MQQQKTNVERSKQLPYRLPINQNSGAEGIGGSIKNKRKKTYKMMDKKAGCLIKRFSLLERYIRCKVQPFLERQIKDIEVAIMFFVPASCDEEHFDHNRH
jgi:hypothetical protein